MSYDYPLAIFYFEVSVDGASIPFQEVGGLEFTLETEEGQGDGNSGGQATARPTKRKVGNLTLKRGLMPISGSFFQWVNDTFHADRKKSTVEPKDMIISLLDEKSGMPLYSWIVDKAYPIKWSFSNLNSMKSEIMLETIEFQVEDMRMESSF